MQVESSKAPYSFYTLVWKSDTPSSKPCYMQVKKSNLKSLFQTGWEIKPQIFATCGLGNSRPQILATCRLGEQKPQILAARKLGTHIPLPQAPPNLCYMEVSKTKNTNPCYMQVRNQNTQILAARRLRKHPNPQTSCYMLLERRRAIGWP